MMVLEDYYGLIPSENRQKPNFLAVLGVILQPMIDAQAEMAALPQKFDIDYAVGGQLDFTGEWIGFSRYLPQPITDVYFSFDTPELGFDEGVIWSPGDPLEGLVRLDDETYRIMLKTKVAANYWDGSLGDAERVLALALIEYPLTHVFIEDNFDMSIDIGITGTVPSMLFQKLIEGDYLPLRPAGVMLNAVNIDPGPFFGFDTQNYNISGFDTGVLS